MNRRPIVLAAAAIALVTGAGLAVPSHAAPPSSSGNYSAPYSGYASYGFNNSCTVGATCSAVGTADAATGRGTSTTSFDRSAPAGGRESIFGYARQWITYKVPAGASSVTATFTWRVDSSSVSASSTAGLIQAYTGVAAYASGCSGECTSEAKSAPVQYAGSADGVPSSGASTAETQPSVTVTVTGKLPRHLTLLAYPYSVAAGTTSQACLNQTTCQTVSETHAGSASSSIEAVLTGVRVTSS